MIQMELTQAETLALSRLFDPRGKKIKALSRALEDGTLEEIDLTVRLTCDLSKGHKKTQTVPAQIKTWALIALLMDKLNETTLEAASMSLNQTEPWFGSRTSIPLRCTWCPPASG